MVSAGMARAAAVVAALLAAHGARAEAPAAVPEVTTASFGDWMVICAGPATERKCEAVLTVRDERGQAAAAIAIGQSAKTALPHMSLRVATNAFVAAPAQVKFGADRPDLPFLLCVPQGCVAEVKLADKALMARLLAIAADAGGQLNWRAASGQELKFSLSTKGMAAALAQVGIVP